MSDHYIESAALIDLCDDLHDHAIDHAEKIAMPRTGYGWTRVAAVLLCVMVWWFFT
jgi:hypothetical protein